MGGHEERSPVPALPEVETAVDEETFAGSTGNCCASRRDSTGIRN